MIYHAIGDKRLKTTLVGRIGRKLRSVRGGLHYQCSKRSYSQCGEDMIVEYVFRLRGIERPTYIDIGANHPFFLNNTASLYERGCRGINIDPNPHAMMLFNEHRPEDVNLNVGVADKAGESDFFVMEDHTLSTLSIPERDHLIAHGQRQARIMKVRLITLPDIIQNYCRFVFPDFMSIDVEGMEMSILKSIDFEKSYPKVICVEIAEYSPIGAGGRRTDIVEFLASKNYFEYAHTNLNAIMVRKEFWFRKATSV
jgi:FkbM family methyltransferase